MNGVSFNRVTHHRTGTIEGLNIFYREAGAR
jgi:hypothetical protein